MVSQYMNSNAMLPLMTQKFVQQINAKNLPEITNLCMSVDMRSLNFTVGVAQSNGYLYFGLDAFQTAKASLEQLRQGYNGNWAPLAHFRKQFLRMNTQQTVYIDRLSDDLQYFIYYAVTGEDPSANAEIKWDVQVLTFKIDRMYNIPESIASVLGFAVIALAGLLLLAL